MRRLACDASVVQVTHDSDGSVLDVGRKTRTIPPALRRALETRDRGCRFPGCGLRFADGHHIHHWADGGPTKLGNCILLCKFHHRLVHEEGYRVALLPGGEPAFHDPRGLPLPNTPPVVRLPEGAVEALMRANRLRGVEPDFRTSSAKYKREYDIPWPVLARALEALDG